METVSDHFGTLLRTRRDEILAAAKRHRGGAVLVGYHRIDPSQVWVTASDHVPPLVRALRADPPGA